MLSKCTVSDPCEVEGTSSYFFNCIGTSLGNKQASGSLSTTGKGLIKERERKGKKEDIYINFIL